MKVPKVLPLLTTDEVQPYVLGCVRTERARQVRLRVAGKFNHTPDEVPTGRAFLMLTEECGESAKAILELSGDVREDTTTTSDLYAELVQVAAVAVAMAEGILHGVPVQ